MSEPEDIDARAARIARDAVLVRLSESDRARFGPALELIVSDDNEEPLVRFMLAQMACDAAREFLSTGRMHGRGALLVNGSPARRVVVQEHEPHRVRLALQLWAAERANTDSTILWCSPLSAPLSDPAGPRVVALLVQVESWSEGPHSWLASLESGVLQAFKRNAYPQAIAPIPEHELN